MMLNRISKMVGTTFVSMTLLCAATAIAQEATAPPSPPQPKSEQPAQPPAPPESLDDLLGIDEEEQDPGAGEAAQRDVDEELQRKLNEQEIADNFALAVEKMSISAELLDVRFDTGLGTQRVQEEIIARLDHLIEQARQNQSQSQSSSSSSSSSSQSQQQQQSQSQDPGQQRNQQQQQQNQGNQRNDQPSDSEEGDPPPTQQGEMNTILEESRSEWGNLPPRIREQLLQGRREKFSSLYQQLTQEYYKRLAEESVP